MKYVQTSQSSSLISLLLSSQGTSLQLTCRILDEHVGVLVRSFKSHMQIGTLHSIQASQQEEENTQERESERAHACRQLSLFLLQARQSVRLLMLSSR